MEDLAPVELRLGLRLETPVERRVANHVHVSDWNPGPDRAVVVAGLEQQDAVRRVRAQAVGQNAAGRAGANNDVVELVGVVVSHWIA